LRRYAENRPKTFRKFYADSIDPFRMLATIDAQATEIAALKGGLEAKEREMLAEHSSAMQALLRWCAEDTPEDIRKGWEQESHEALRALAAGRPR
jgi:predicted transcriptional regulator